MLALLVVGATTLLSGQLPASPPSDPVVVEGVRLRNALDYEAALALFERELAAEPRRSAPERARLHVYAGVLSAELRAFDAARTHFDEALLLAPEVSLELDVSPTIDELFAEAKAAAMFRSAPAVAPAPAPSPVWLYTGVGLASTGALVGVAGAALFLAGVVRYFDAESASHQQEVAQRNAESMTLQIAGQGVLAVGAALLVVGAGVVLFVE